MKRLLKIIAVLILVGGVSGVLFASFMIRSAKKDLPELGSLIDDYNTVIPTQVFDANGEVIDFLFKEIREEAELEELPKHLKDAYIAIEDKRFYEHHGIDILRTGKSAFINIVLGRKAQGGSTLTQQLSRNAFLTLDKTWSRKVKELIIALEIERRFTKDEILTKYVNEIYFGSGAYGVKTAARAFFDKEISEVNLAEGAMLAGVTNSPGMYSPRYNLENSIKRQKLILKMMEKNGYITSAEHREALKHKFIKESDFKGDEVPEDTTIIKERSNKNRLYKSPDFTNIIERRLFSMFPEKMIYEEGLKVYTTLDLRLQNLTKKEFEGYSKLKNIKELQGGLVTMEADTGHVKALIAGKNFKTKNFNRAYMAKRQAGSTFKPFLYFTAMDMGMPMSTIVEDSPVSYGKGNDYWRPKNFSKRFRRGLTMKEAMERSVNISAIRILEKTGVRELSKRVRAAGGEFRIPNVLSTALGTVEVSPLELAEIYMPFANGGFKTEPVFITKVENRFGEAIYENRAEPEKIFESDNVALITHMLKSVVSGKTGSGAGARVKKGEEFIAQGGKTGTTNENRTAWFAGITPKYVTTLYIGFDKNKKMPKNYTGGRLAAPLWGKIYQAMVDAGYQTGDSFKFIDDGVRGGNLVYETIDARTGMLPTKRTQITEEALFRRGNQPLETITKYSTNLTSTISAGATMREETKPETVEGEELIKTEELIGNEEEQSERNREVDSYIDDLFEDN